MKTLKRTLAFFRRYCSATIPMEWKKKHMYHIIQASTETETNWCGNSTDWWWWCRNWPGQTAGFRCTEIPVQVFPIDYVLYPGYCLCNHSTQPHWVTDRQTQADRDKLKRSPSAPFPINYAPHPVAGYHLYKHRTHRHQYWLTQEQQKPCTKANRQIDTDTHIQRHGLSHRSSGSLHSWYVLLLVYNPILVWHERPQTTYSGWPKVCHNAMTMPESREAHCK